MKGSIKPDHMAVNKYQLLVLGIPPLTFTKISGIESELESVDLPDRTRASGGNKKAISFTAMLPMHHFPEVAAMEAWLVESSDPVLPTYKKTATLIHFSISGLQLRTYQIAGIFPTKRKLPDLEMKNEGELAEHEWSFSGDDIFPLT